MKGSYKDNIFILMFLSGIVFSLTALNGCVAAKQASVTTPIKIKGKKEILVARNIGRGGNIYHPNWCGNNALLYEGDNIGIEIIDFITKKRFQISETSNNTALNCSPDGRWVLYESYSIIKTEKQGDLSYSEYVKKSSEVGSTARYIYRQEVSTGRKERVAVAGIDEGGSYEAISPDGTKILLGNKHLLNTDIYLPEWEPAWFSNDSWERYDTRWFADSLGVVNFRHNPNRICVEFFGKDGWGKCFELDLKYKDNIYGLLLDKDGRIYFQIGSGYLDASGIYSVYRCEIKERQLECKKVAEERKGGSPSAILPNGDLILSDDCIRRAVSWHAEGECVADRRYGDIEYASIFPVGVSPNGRWLAFHRYHNELKMSRGWLLRPADLFVIDLKND